MRILRRSRSVVSWTRCGSGPSGGASEDQGADRGTEPALAGLGRVLQTRPRPQALPPSRRLDPATHLVASVPSVGAMPAGNGCLTKLVRRVRACQVDLFNSFSCILASLSLRESCMRETCTCSLGGGRRPARKRASSDPTTAPCQMVEIPTTSNYAPNRVVSVMAWLQQSRGLAQCKKGRQRSGGPPLFLQVDSVTYILTGEP